MIQTNVSATLGTSQDQTLFVPAKKTEVKNVERMEQQTTHERTNVQKCRGGQRMPDKDNFEAVVEDEEYCVRRLIPKECARLQGFPPDWCADVPHSDSAEYKLWGNGIALPSILPMMQNAVNLLIEWKETEGR